MATTPALRRQPPPPPLIQDPALNRWLHDLTAFISASGGIDPNQVAGLAQMQGEIANNTASIHTLQGQVNSLASSVSTLNSVVSTLAGTVSTLNDDVTALQGQLAALPAMTYGAANPTGGKSGDWFAQTTTPGHLWVNESGTWTQVI